MSDFYREMQSVASGVLSEFQQGSVSYIETTPGSGPKDDPGQPSEVPYPLKAVVRGVQFKYIGNGSVVASDMQTTWAGDGPEPKITGFIQVDGKRFKIVQIVRKPSAGTPVAWTVIFRN